MLKLHKKLIFDLTWFKNHKNVNKSYTLSLYSLRWLNKATWVIKFGSSHGWPDLYMLEAVRGNQAHHLLGHLVVTGNQLLSPHLLEHIVMTGYQLLAFHWWSLTHSPVPPPEHIVVPGKQLLTFLST